MHYRLFITITPDESPATSEAVRRQVVRELDWDPTFCHEGGRFAHRVCDYFVIGGRWSGLFQSAPPDPAVDEDATLGHPADARPLTTALYDEWLAEFVGQSLVRDEEHCRFVDLEDEPLSRRTIGRKWLVVVDYHR
jgi:hypothetical protein